MVPFGHMVQPYTPIAEGVVTGSEGVACGPVADVLPEILIEIERLARHNVRHRWAVCIQEECEAMLDDSLSNDIKASWGFLFVRRLEVLQPNLCQVGPLAWTGWPLRRSIRFQG